MADNESRRCIKITQSGTQCKKYKVADSDFCNLHTPKVGPNNCRAPTLGRKTDDRSQVKLCGKKVVTGKRYCGTHLYMDSYTDEMMNNLKRCEPKNSCGKFYYSDKDKCSTCMPGKIER